MGIPVGPYEDCILTCDADEGVNSFSSALMSELMSVNGKIKLNLSNTISSSGINSESSSVVSHSKKGWKRIFVDEQTMTEYEREDDDFFSCGISAECWRVLNRETGTHCALKLYRSGETKEKALREFEMMRQLSHPNIVQVFGYGMRVRGSQSRPWIVMELCVMDLCDALIKLGDFRADENKSPPRQESRYIFRDVVRALSYLHQQDIVHLDVKLENILISTYFDEDFNLVHIFKLTDFGHAVKKGSKDTFHYGTSFCTSPELLYLGDIADGVSTWPSISIKDEDGKKVSSNVPLAGTISFAQAHSNFDILVQGDIWAAGCLLFELYYRFNPFVIFNNAQLTKHYIWSGRVRVRKLIADSNAFASQVSLPCGARRKMSGGKKKKGGKVDSRAGKDLSKELNFFNYLFHPNPSERPRDAVKLCNSSFLTNVDERMRVSWLSDSVNWTNVLDKYKRLEKLL